MTNSNIDKVIALAAKDTKKGSRVIAKVFFRVLRKQGFTENQIIAIATDIINCLIESLKEKERLTLDSEKGIPRADREDYIPPEEGKIKTITKINNRYCDNESIHYCA